MSEWQEFLIEDLADFCNAKRVPLSSMQRQQLQGSYPYYGASGIVDYVNDYIFEGSHVLISEDGENLKSRNTPIAFEASGKFWVNNHAHILKAKEQHLTKILIHYFAQLDLSPYLTGAVQPKLNKATLSKIPLYLPSSIAEQKAIASVLSSLDDKIDLLHRQNKTLEAMAETLFRQWFIEDAKEDWEETTLEHHIVAIKGLSYKGSGLCDVGQGIPMFNLNSVLEGGGYKTTGLKYYKGDYKEHHLVKADDIIVANTEQGHEHRLIGFPAVIPSYFNGENIFTHHIFKVSLLESTYLTNQFIYYLLCSSAVREQITGATNGSTVNQLAADGLQRPRFRLPPKNLVQNFTNQVISFWKKKDLNQQQIWSLEKLRDTLLPKLMSGEVRVQFQTEEVA